MKHQYRQTKPHVIQDELYDIERPQKKRGKKKKLFSVISTGWGKTTRAKEHNIILGHYMTQGSAEQARTKYARDWANCVIVKQIT